MNWIKENKFLAGLAGGTLGGAIILIVVGMLGSGKYDSAKETFDTSYEEASGFEKLPLYPKVEHKDAKTKALGEYTKLVEALQADFEPFRPKEIKNLSPQEFTDSLLAANAEVRKAFEDGGTVVPEPFFMGFERYKTSLAAGGNTGILNYQLGAIKSLMLDLAKAKPSELKNFYRQTLQEEDGQTYTPGEGVARPFPMELTFTGTEKSVREFVSALSKIDKQYVVVRALRISNVKKDPPRASDAQFDKPAAEEKSSGGGGDAFSGGFVLPGDDAAAPAADASAAATPAAADSSRILSQVLGTEQLNVFLRLDLLEFLPAKKLP